MEVRENSAQRRTRTVARDVFSPDSLRLNLEIKLNARAVFATHILGVWQLGSFPIF